MAAPPSINFVGELIVGISVVKISFSMLLVVGLMTFLSGVYNLYLFSMTVGNYYNFLSKGSIFMGEIISLMGNIFVIFLSFFLCSYF